MYEFDWAQSGSFEAGPCQVGAGSTSLPLNRVAATALLHWQEHCVECAAPHCYQTCGLFSPRPDGHCGRFSYGIVRNRAFAGLFDHGADLRFRRWAKLETYLFGRSVSTRAHRLADRMERNLIALTRAGSRFEGSGRSIFRRVTPALRRRLHPRLLYRAPQQPYDDFVLECYSPEEGLLHLILEVSRAERVLFRHAFPIERGRNFHAIPIEEMNIGGDWSSGKVSLFPENDAECRLVFTWLDFVRYSKDRREPRAVTILPAPRVKCVAWDLDNTLWRGTLVESGGDSMVVDPEAASLIRRLDERGILQTVVSKNDHDAAWEQIECLGLAEFFLHPAINWGQKSNNLRQIASRLNIGLDSFALIDDAAFERAEVAESLKQVRVYSEKQIPGLLQLAEFDVPITELSRRRRESYRINAERELVQGSFSGSYEDFLRSCGMTMRIFVPTDRTDRERCLELIQRSNQLNLSTHRYTEAEFEQLLSRPNTLSVAFQCADRFGDYGIVGFASVAHDGSVAALAEFVLSCRAAQKRVEHTFLQWLADRERLAGREVLSAEFVRTERNGPLHQVFEDTPFECSSDDGVRRLLELRLDALVWPRPVMQLKDEVSETHLTFIDPDRLPIT